MIRSKAVLAPMSGITDIPFRLMTRKYGCGFAFTEMIDVNGIIYNSHKTFDMMERIPEDLPLGVQLVGEDVKKFIKVGKICEGRGFKLLDINAGCPARKVVKGGKGSALMKDIKKLAGIVAGLKAALNISVTVKIRSGWDQSSINCVEMAKALESAGADAIGIHPRTKEQMYKGKADHNLTLRVKGTVRIPVIASGNIFNAKDAEDVLISTGCDAVFIARGALGCPWIFDDIKKGSIREGKAAEMTFNDLKAVIIEHYEICLRFYNEIMTKKRMYKHLIWYFNKYKNKNDIMKKYQAGDGTAGFKAFMDKLELCDGKLILNDPS